MKDKIANWLITNYLKDLLKSHNLLLETRIKFLENNIEEINKNNQYLTMCVKGMMEHLDLEWKREEILDPRYLEQPKTIPIIKFYKRTKK